MKQRTVKITDQELIDSYNELKHLGRIADRYKVPTISIWRRCKKLGLEFKNGGTCHKQIPLEEILAGNHGHYPTGKLKKRLIKEKILEYKCAECSRSKWRGKTISLHLDHINGTPTDHRLENLRFMCPNCHSQTDTYCGKNK
jgi:hypothetical protein